MRYRYWVSVGASLILGLIFVASSVGKIAEPSEFLTALASASFLPPKVSTLIAQWLPWVELVLGLLLITGISAKLAASASSLLVAGFIFYNTWVIEHGLGLDDCGCIDVRAIEEMFKLEQQIKLSSEMARYMDIGMLALILAILLCYPGKFFTIRPWWWFLTERKTTGGSSNNEGI